MMRALYTAASGMQAQQYNIDTISNNLANVNTTGFRKNEARFADLIYQNLRAPGTPVGPSVVPVGQDVGLGVKIGASEKAFTQGVLQQTGNPLDLAIEGDGFFQVTRPDGTIGYTRDGSFKRDANGSIVTADGYLLSPQITVPANATQVSVGADGTVTALIPGQQQPQQLGQITLVRFTNPAGLAPTGQNLFLQTGASGAPTISQPGLNGTGTLQGGYLEQSNVSVVDEMVALITAQRAYEANSKAITTADNMLGTAVNMKQG
jgi:flagellar basal-body rod protein FlgG